MGDSLASRERLDMPTLLITSDSSSELYMFVGWIWFSLSFNGLISEIGLQALSTWGGEGACDPGMMIYSTTSFYFSASLVYVAAWMRLAILGVIWFGERSLYRATRSFDVIWWDTFTSIVFFAGSSSLWLTTLIGLLICRLSSFFNWWFLSFIISRVLYIGSSSMIGKLGSFSSSVSTWSTILTWRSFASIGPWWRASCPALMV